MEQSAQAVLELPSLKCLKRCDTCGHGSFVHGNVGLMVHSMILEVFSI